MATAADVSTITSLVEAAVSDAGLHKNQLLRESLLLRGDRYLDIALLMSPGWAGWKRLSTSSVAQLAEAIEASDKLELSEDRLRFRRVNRFDPEMPQPVMEKKTKPLAQRRKVVVKVTNLPWTVAAWRPLKNAVVEGTGFEWDQVITVVDQQAQAPTEQATAGAAGGAGGGAGAAAPDDASASAATADADAKAATDPTTQSETERPASRPAFVGATLDVVKSPVELLAVLKDTVTAHGVKLQFQRMAKPDIAVFEALEAAGKAVAEKMKARSTVPVVTIAERTFPSREQLKRTVYAIVNDGDNHRRLEGDDATLIEALLLFHPRHAEKTKNVDHYEVGPHPKYDSRCLLIARADGTKEDISWMKCVIRVPDSNGDTGEVEAEAARYGRARGGGRPRGRGRGRGRRGGGRGGRRWRGRGRGRGRGGGRGGLQVNEDRSSEDGNPRRRKRNKRGASASTTVAQPVTAIAVPL